MSIIRFLYKLTGGVGATFLLLAVCGLDSEGEAYSLVVKLVFLGAGLLLTSLIISKLFVVESEIDDFN